VHNEQHPFRAHHCDKHFFSPTLNPLPVLCRPSSNIWLVLVASTRRLSTQRAGTHGFHSSFSDTLPSRYTATSHARASKHPRTYLSIAHCTPLPPLLLLPPLSSTPPPPALLLITAPIPFDHRCLALLEHCTCHKPFSTHQHGTLLPQLSAIIPRFLWHPPPIHVRIKTDRHSIQAAL
jgi:hypothetical protein